MDLKLNNHKSTMHLMHDNKMSAILRHYGVIGFCVRFDGYGAHPKSPSGG